MLRIRVLYKHCKSERELADQYVNKDSMAIGDLLNSTRCKINAKTVAAIPPIKYEFLFKKYNSATRMTCNKTRLIFKVCENGVGV